MQIKSVIVVGLLLLASTVRGRESEVDAYIREATVKVEFVIAKSTGSYAEAHRVALDASKRLSLRLDLRDLSPTRGGGLSFPKAICEADGWEAPCYVARGRGDDGAYVSIESSNAYSEFRRGLYVVMLASGQKADPEVRKVLATAKGSFPDAYSKVAGVYMGCMH
jgi:hypothetical protein